MTDDIRKKIKIAILSAAHVSSWYGVTLMDVGTRSCLALSAMFLRQWPP